MALYLKQQLEKTVLLMISADDGCKVLLVALAAESLAAGRYRVLHHSKWGIDTHDNT